MMEDIGHDDLVMMYQDTVVLYKDKPVFIEKVEQNQTIHYMDLNNQRLKSAKFDSKLFLPPTRRLGMVNVNGSVVYAARMPVRKYRVGLAPENTEVRQLDVPYPLGRGDTVQKVRRLSIPEVADALFNIYPPIKEAFDRAVESGGACAFDKQFAISNNGSIFYKTKKVGLVKKAPIAVSDIKFNAGFEYLESLLEQSYG